MKGQGRGQVPVACSRSLRTKSMSKSLLTVACSRTFDIDVSFTDSSFVYVAKAPTGIWYVSYYVSHLPTSRFPEH